MNLKPQYPLDGKLGKDWKVTSKFGWRIHPIQKTKKHHNGTDLWGPKAKIWIESWHSGKVIFAGKSKQKQKDGSLGGHGWYVDVASKISGQWYVTRYAHMVADSLTVKVGQKIQPGARLGIMGTTGASTGKHLHLEILKGKAYRWSPDGKGYLDPLKFIKATIDNWEIQQAAPQPTPDDGVVEPAPVHGSSPSVSKAPVLPIKPKSVATLANEVLAGKWGSGAARTKKLNSAGHNAKAVQALVNKILSGKK